MRFLVGLVGMLAAMALAGADGASSPRVAHCDRSRLAFALPQPSAPTQTQAIGFSVHNVGPVCRLALPIRLTLANRDDSRLRVQPAVSRLTLRARTIRRNGSGSVIWTYTNYCGGQPSSSRPIAYTVAVSGIELRGRGGAATCYTRAEPVALRVLFACPSATGPAIDAILPRPLPLCR